MEFFSLLVSFAESVQVKLIAFGGECLQRRKIPLGFAVAFVIAFDVLALPLWV